jgi:putative DNA methylase
MLQNDLFGEPIYSQKTVASNKIDVKIVDTWEQFGETTNSLMVLNRNSAELPLPADSVDVVVTDPPYFDFVHYSELSDFFFAWLSPVLKTRYPWFDKDNSSSSGEVQHKDPGEFAKLLGDVLAECSRVLNGDGLLAFSFHHSRYDGWLAIYKAVTSAGLKVVAAHPVHAELRAASPKSAAKDPISLDAILVCKKEAEQITDSLDEAVVQEKSEEIIRRLESAGMSISQSDRFVVRASQMLILLCERNASLDEACSLLQELR